MSQLAAAIPPQRTIAAEGETEIGDACIGSPEASPALSTCHCTHGSTPYGTRILLGTGKSAFLLAAPARLTPCEDAANYAQDECVWLASETWHKLEAKAAGSTPFHIPLQRVKRTAHLLVMARIVRGSWHGCVSRILHRSVRPFCFCPSQWLLLGLGRSPAVPTQSLLSPHNL